MLKKFIPAVSIISVLFISSCGDDDSTPSTPSNPEIEVTASETLPGDFGVSQQIAFSILLTADPSVGIASFVITKGGEELVNEASFGGNIVTFNYPYTTSWDDAQSGSAALTMTMTDAGGKFITANATINVSVEYGYFNDNLIPVPGYDLVGNAIADPASDPGIVDIVRGSLIGGGSTYSSQSTTEYFEVALSSVDLLDPNLTTAQIEAAISGVSPVSSVIVANGQGFPFVAKLRGSNDYTVISEVDTTFNPVRLGYRKISASAGQ
jgi:hypothetical protein